MLGDFPLSVTLAGQRVDLIARDVAAAVFFQGYPEQGPGEDARDQPTLERAVERWMVALLTRVIAKPRLTLEEVHRLDNSGLPAAVGYLRAVGWITEGGLEAIGHELVPADLAMDPVTVDVVLLPFIAPVVTNVRQALIDVAVRTGTRPSAIWQSPISDFLFDWRILAAQVASEELAR